MVSDIDDPLKPFPFKRLNIGQVEQVHEFIRRKASVKGELENMHLCPRAAELRWNKAMKEEETELELDIPGEEVLSPT